MIPEDFPEEIMKDEHIQTYTKYTPDGLIVFKAHRQSTARDIPPLYKDGEIIVQGSYYGEWLFMPQNEIDEINKQKMSARKKAREHYSKYILLDDEAENKEYDDLFVNDEDVEDDQYNDPYTQDEYPNHLSAKARTKREEEIKKAQELLKKLKALRDKALGDNRPYEG